jgi:hypothetical protein
MTTGTIITEAQRNSAYQRAIRNYTAPFLQVEPRAQQMAAQPPATSPQELPRSMKHALLIRLHARSNAGAVQIKDVSRIFDELTGQDRPPAR